jgi:hypothetical protein
MAQNTVYDSSKVKKTRIEVQAGMGGGGKEWEGLL